MPFGHPGTITLAQIPQVGSTGYAEKINQFLLDVLTTCETKIDCHSMDITQSMDFNNNTAANLKSVLFQSQSTDEIQNHLYVKNNNLHFRDSTSSIQLTENGVIKGVPKGIAGDYNSTDGSISYSDTGVGNYQFLNGSNKAKVSCKDVSFESTSFPINLNRARQTSGVATGILTGGILQGTILGNAYEWGVDGFKTGDIIETVSVMVLSDTTTSFTFSFKDSDGNIIAATNFSATGGELDTFVVRSLTINHTVLSTLSYCCSINMNNAADRVKCCLVTIRRD